MVRQSPSCRTPLLALLALLGCAGGHPAVSPFATVCPSGAAVRPDTIAVTVYIQPTTGIGRGMAEPAPDAGLAAAAIAESFHPPRTITLAHPVAWPEQGGAKSHRAVPLLDATLDLSRPTPGGPIDAWFRTPTGSPPLNAAFLEAIVTADSVGSLKTVLQGSTPDTLHLMIGGAVEPPTAATGLFHVRVNYYPLDEPARATEQPTPHHPAPGFDDAVDLRYVVDAKGHPLPGTIEVMRARYREMAAEAKRVIAASKFKPAHANGCAVPQLVFQRVGFHTKQ